MAEKRVIAYFMHESEMAEATQRLHQAEVTDSFVVGRVDEAEIPTLEQHGLIVQTLDDDPVEDTAVQARENLQAGGLTTFGARAAGAAAPGRPAGPEIDETGPNFYLIRLDGPLLEHSRTRLEALQCTVLERVPPASYTARLDPQQAHQVADLPFVSALRLYKPEDTGPVALTLGAPPPLDTPGPTRPRAIHSYDIRLHRDEDRLAILAWLDDHDVAVAGTGGRKIRIYALEESAVLDEIGALPEVSLLEEYVEPKLFNDVARVLMTLDPAVAADPPPIALDGDGQLVAVADTGLDDGHPDFAGRIDTMVALGRAGDTSDPHGHGTHVAGSVLGDGTASQGRIRGAAPKARLFFQSLLDARGGLGGLPVDLGELFQQAYDAGARIHSNSWGAATESAYTMNSEDVDEFVARNRDMLILIAAGNEGQAKARFHSPQGFPDWLSIGSPATSKNALTVGASRSSRNDGAISNMTWSKAWPDSFPDPPLADETVSGDPESLAGFSSRGPCDDRRIKPDVVAPGTDIASTKSSIAPSREFWGPYPGFDNRYAYMGGTSMATPLVSGCAALVRQYFMTQRQHEPSAALLKATLINGTRWLTGADSVVDQNAVPNYNQGFGSIHMVSTLPNTSQPALGLEFVDSWQEPATQFRKSGQRFRFTVPVAGGDQLRICLAYTDLPARGLQNDLNLIVQEPGGAKHVGNEQLPERLTPLDRGNNVEIVRIADPAPGDYLIQVSAFNLLDTAGQDFALVVTGDLGAGLAPL